MSEELIARLDEKYKTVNISGFEEYSKDATELYNSINGSAGESAFLGMLKDLDSLYNGFYSELMNRTIEIVLHSKEAQDKQRLFSEHIKYDSEKLDKKPNLERVCTAIERNLINQQEAFRRIHNLDYNLAGGIIFGDYCTNKLHPRIDLNLELVKLWESKGDIPKYEDIEYVYDFNPRTDFDSVTHFSELVERELGSVSIYAPYYEFSMDKFDEIVSTIMSPEEIIKGKYIFVSPFDDIRSKFEEIKNE